MRRKKAISYGSQSIDLKDLEQIQKSLFSSQISNGKFVKKFENNIKKKLKTKFVFSCNSGTSAIHLAYLGCGLKDNDIIILPTINFIAAANIAKIMKLKIFFADIDYQTGQISPETIKKCIEKNNLKKINAIVLMYIGGYPRNINNYKFFKKKYNCFIIEDACHAFGAKYYFKGKTYFIGSCKHADVSTFSFHPLKTITTGEGGAITTNNIKIAKTIKANRSHGLINIKKKEHWKYKLLLNGYNFRLSDINCALGLGQLKKVNFFINQRKKIFNTYLKELNSFENLINIIHPEKKTFPSFHLVIMQIDFSRMIINKDAMLRKLINKNIFCQYHYIPNYKFIGFNNKIKNSFANSERYFKNSISIPIHLGLKSNDLRYIIKNIKLIVKNYARKN